MRKKGILDRSVGPGPTPGWEASLGERTTQRIYARLGWRLFPAMAAVSVAIVVVGGFIVNYGGLVGYLDGSSEQFLTAAAVTAALAVPGSLLLLYAAWRNWQPVAAWLRDGDESGTSAEEAWLNATIVPVRIFTWLLVWNCLAGAVTAFLYVKPEFALEFWQTLLFLIGGMSGALGVWVALVFLVDFMVKPLLADVAGALPPDWQVPSTRWSVRAKAMTALPALTFGVAIGALAFVPAGGSPVDRMGVTIAAAAVVTLVAGVPLIMMVTEAIQQPLRMLRAGTGRVARGDYSQPIPPTTADEFGGVVTSFNRMQQGLTERERLAGENTQLLDEVHASRARLVSASDAERRRVERNLHDGAQQQLVAVGSEAPAARAKPRRTSPSCASSPGKSRRTSRSPPTTFASSRAVSTRRS